MRIVTHRTELVIETYDLPDEMRAATDEELLAEAEQRVPISGRREQQDDLYVADRGEDDIETAAAAYRDARTAADRAEHRAKALLTAAAENGYSEHRLAGLLGVDRMTIRRWRGKT